MRRHFGALLVHAAHPCRYYLDQVGEEINETLQDTGAVNLSDLAKRFGLYSDFLKEAINARLGKIIRGKLENGVGIEDGELLANVPLRCSIRTPTSSAIPRVSAVYLPA